jgi:hypothetical protein
MVSTSCTQSMQKARKAADKSLTESLDKVLHTPNMGVCQSSGSSVTR